MTGKPHGGLQCWHKLLPLWSSDQSSEAWVLLASHQWNAAHWRRTCWRLVGGSLLTPGSYRFPHLPRVPPLKKLFRYLMWNSYVCACLCVFLDDLKEKLMDFVSETNSQRPGFIKMVRHSKQEGLIRSRVSGWRAATAPVVALFDAHVEFNVGWWVTRKACGTKANTSQHKSTGSWVISLCVGLGNIIWFKNKDCVQLGSVPGGCSLSLSTLCTRNDH